jgi:hypothetical protein
MDWKSKAALIGVILLVIFFLGFIIKIQNDAIERLQSIEKSMVESKELSNGLVRAQSSYITKKDLERMIADQGLDLGEIKRDLRSLGAEVKAIQVVEYTTPGGYSSGLGSTTTIPRPDGPSEPVQCPEGGLCPNIDPYGYLDATQRLALSEPFNDEVSIPFGAAEFSAWQVRPWGVEVLPRDYNITTVLGQDEDGRHYAYSKFSIGVDGEEYNIPIEAEFKEEIPAPKFRFSPRIYLGADGGAIMNPAYGEFTGSIGVHFFSYGKTKTNPTWTFLGVGIGYASQSAAGAAVVTPVTYNVGKPLPLIDNLHIGPAVSVDFDGRFGLYLGARIGL